MVSSYHYLYSSYYHHFTIESKSSKLLWATCVFRWPSELETRQKANRLFLPALLVKNYITTSSERDVGDSLISLSDAATANTCSPAGRRYFR